MTRSAENDSIPPLADGCWIVTGATGSGKSTVACALARKIGGEILSLDSMAIYQGMDLGTAKPSAEQRQSIPHHLLDLVPPTVEFSVSEYLRRAAIAVPEVRSRQKVPVFVGGTPMWLMGLVRGMYVGPPADWEFRREVEAELQELGVEALRERLWQVDPLTAHRLHDHDTRRMIRALEVARATGKPLSHQQSHFDQPRRPDEVCVLVLSWPRKILHERINRRVDYMFENGLIEEVRSLLANHGSLSRTAAQAVGYRETIAYLRGQASLADTVATVKAHTRQLAKRQETWLRSFPEARWIAMRPELETEQVCQKLIEVAGIKIFKANGTMPRMERALR